MPCRPLLSLACFLLLCAACSSTEGLGSDPAGEGGPAAGGAASAGSAGGKQVAAAGALTSAGGRPSAGQSGDAGGGAGGAPGSIAAGGAFAAPDSGGAHAGGRDGAGGRGGSSGAGGVSGTGGAPPSGGRGGASTGGASSTACPGAGHISYTLSKSASPTATERTAYDKITIAMDKAIKYYDCYTNITKSLKISYVPSVETADGNSNGSIRFGSNTTYMDYRSAMHEIAHTVGIGQASSWGSFIANGLFTGAKAAAQLNAINATLSKPLYTELHADTQHFWPYGLNQQSEVKSEADLIFHCQMVVAIRKDLGLE